MDIKHRTRGRVPAGLLLLVSVILVTPAGVANADDFLHSSNRALRRAERDALEEVLDGLAHPDPTVRHDAVLRLAGVGRTAIPGLREQVMEGSDPKRLSMALLALGAIAEPEAMAVVQEYLLRHGSHEDTVRACLLALTRDSRTISEELARSLRLLARDASQYTVAQVAILSAAARGLSGLATTFSSEFRNESQPRVRGTWLLAFAEAGGVDGVPLVRKELKSRKTLARRTALYAAARMGDPALLKELMAFRADDEERDQYCLALGAFAADEVVERLETWLRRYRQEVPSAAYSLAAIGSGRALAVLETALEGEWGDDVRALSCLAVAGHLEGQRFLPLLREAVQSTHVETRRAATLALALAGDVEVAALLLPRLRKIKDAEEQRLAALACVPGLSEADLGAWDQAGGPLAELAQQVREIRAGRRDARLLRELITAALSAQRAHWSLRRDDLREALLAEFLDLGRIRFSDGSSDGGTGGGSDTGGGDDGSGGDGSGGDGSGGDDDGAGTGTAPTIPWGSRRRNRADFARFEADLQLWLVKFPLFPISRPWAEL